MVNQHAITLDCRLGWQQVMKNSPPWHHLRRQKLATMQQIYRRIPMSMCDFNKVAKQLYWNHTSAWVFSCKIATYFQNTFSKEHLWRAASDDWYICWFNIYVSYTFMWREIKNKVCFAFWILNSSKFEITDKENVLMLRILKTDLCVRCY